MFLNIFFSHLRNPEVFFRKKKIIGSVFSSQFHFVEFPSRKEKKTFLKLATAEESKCNPFGIISYKRGETLKDTPLKINLTALKGLMCDVKRTSDVTSCIDSQMALWFLANTS